MAYADPQPVSTRKVVSLIIVVILHVLVGYAFVSGLAYKVYKKAVDKTDLIDVKEAPPPPEKPPPPPPEQKVEPPPVVAPPPIVAPPVISAPVIQSVPTPPPVVIPTPAPPITPPPPPAPPTISKAASAKGNPGSWVTSDDYPPNALRNNEQGTVGLSFTINTTGHLENCQVVSSSGSNELDQTACKLVMRRGRYAPAVDSAGNPTTQKQTLRFTWRLPTE